MALFGKKEPKPPARPESTMRQVAARNAYCRICNAERVFATCWTRTAPLTQCSGCRQAFQHPAAVYRQTLPACPHCGEYVEHPGFTYGVCGGCGSKFELMPGTKPSLLPSKRQRDAMDKHGKTWSPH